VRNHPSSVEAVNCAPRGSARELACPAFPNATADEIDLTVWEIIGVSAFGLPLRRAAPAQRARQGNVADARPPRQVCQNRLKPLPIAGGAITGLREMLNPGETQ
jgi:hypothetical protein